MAGAKKTLKLLKLSAGGPLETIMSGVGPRLMTTLALTASIGATLFQHWYTVEATPSPTFQAAKVRD